MIWLLACSGQIDLEPEAEVVPTMKASHLLIRTSLDLRGVRPSADEFDRVEADPDALEDLVEDYLVDERFGGRVRDIYSEILLTRSETFNVTAESYNLPDQAAFEQALGDESLRILSTVAEEDLPWTEVVTADWTMANEVTSQMWPVEYPDGSSGWVRSSYTDGRPMAGVLSTNSLWWRYTSTPSNANRKRANHISRIFLCNDYLVRPIDFDRNVNLLDDEAVSDALRNDPSCVNCHDSLDPLAAYLFGFFHYNDQNPLEITNYHPERELLYKDYLGVEPAYYGTPGFTLEDLGESIAGDNRFVECTVETVYEGLLRRESDLADADALTGHREAFLEGELTMRALMRSVVQDEKYQAGATDLDGFVPKKMATADLLATQVEGLTGFSWTYGGYDLMRSDRYGYRTLAGGADGTNVTSTATSPNTTLLLVQERLSQAAAWYVAESDAQGGDKLFTEIDFSETPDTDRDAMVRQVQALHWAVFGNRVDADGPEVEANLELWADLYAIEGSTVDAWAGVVSVLLRDPDFLFY
ncbi:MAG: hypothetical protein GY884_28315 [Proteobacteria bacterium]|nr:hypothetical protein [Pseudomonadota bacterium]